jgi:protein translocase SecG subunit
MKQALFVVQIVTGAVLILFILVQVKGVGFGRVWGGDSHSFTRRGLEKLVFKLTFVVSALFIAFSLISLL